MKARHFRKNAKLRGLSLFLALLFVVEPVTLVNSWLSPAHAEKKAAVKVAVATVDDASGVKVKDVALKLSDALYIAFTQSGLYDVASKEKVAEAVTSAGAAASKDPATLAKVGKALSIKIVFSASLKALAFSKGKPEAVATVSAQGVDADTGDVVAKIEIVKSSGIKPGYAGNQEFLAQEAINMAASAVVDEFFKYQTVEATVLSTRENKYIVSFGKYHGINPGAEFVVLRKKETVAVLKATKVSGNDSEAVLLTKKPGPPIVAGDTAKILHNPPRAVSVDKLGLPKKKKSWTTIAIGIAVIGAAALLLGKKKETTAPEEPVPTVTGVTASPQADNKIRVSWQPVTYSKLAGYVVYRAEDTGGAPGQFVCAGEVSPGVQFFDDEGKTCGQAKEKKEALVTGKSYWYQVAVKTTTGQVSGFSTVDDKQKNSLATAGAKAKPNAPTVNPPKPGGGKAFMSWTPPTTRSDAAATALLSSEISGYWVYYSTDSTNFTVNSRTFFAHTVGSTQITVTVTGLTNNTQYYFVVSTVDTDQQESAFSGLVTATPVAAPAPKMPEWTKKCAAIITNTATSEVDDPACSLVPKSTKVELKWKSVTVHKDGTCYKNDSGCATTPYEDTLSGYKVYRIASTTLETDRTKYSLILSPTTGAGQEMSASDTGVTNDTTYFYYIRALNDEGAESELPADNTDILGPVTPKQSTTGPGQTTDTPPPAPTNVKSIAGIAKVTITWDPVDTGSESDLDGYNVYMSTSSFNPQTGFTKLTGQLLSPQQTSHIQPGLTNGTTYYFYVTAVDKAGGNYGVALESQPSAVAAGIPQPPVPPASPLWASGTAPDPKPIVPATGSLTLNWVTVTKDVNGGDVNVQEAPLSKYRIYRSVASDFSSGANGDYTQLAEVTSPTISYKDTTASDPAKYYFYRVQAVLNDGTAGPLSEFRYGQVQQPAIVLYTPDKGAWVVADPPTATTGTSSTGCGCVDGNGNGYCDTLDLLPLGTPDGQPDDTWYSKFDWEWNSLNYSWNPVEGATRYILEVAHDANMTSLDKNIVIDGQGANNQSIDWAQATCDRGSIGSSFPNGTPDRPDEIPETTMWWRIKAVNDLGLAYAVSEVRAFTLSGTALSTTPKVPNAPTALTLQGTPTPTNVTFSWTAPTKNTDGTNIAAGTTEDIQLYNVYWAVAAEGPFTFISSVLSPTTQFTHTNPSSGFVNYYKVSTVNKAGREGSESIEFASANIAALDPAKPTAFSATAGNKSVQLTWTAPTGYSNGSPFTAGDSISSYTIERSLTSSFTSFTSFTASVSPYADSNVENGVQYFYRVKAVSTYGFKSAASDTVNATPLSDSAPASPQSVQAIAQDSSVRLTWVWDETLGKDIRGFEIWRAPWDPSQPAPDWVTVSADPANNSVCQSAGAAATCVGFDSCADGNCSPSPRDFAYTDTGRQNGGYYYYFLRAVNRCDEAAVPCADNHGAQSPGTGLRVKPLSNADPTVAVTVGTTAPCVAAGACTDKNVSSVTLQWDSAGFTPGSTGTPPGIDLSGYFVYAADLPSTVQALADLQKGTPNPINLTPGNNYFVANNQLETRDVGNAGDNGTGAPYEAVINQYKTTSQTPATMILGTVYYTAVQPYRYVDTNADGTADTVKYGPLSTLYPAQPYTTTVPPAATITTATPLNQAASIAWSAAAPAPDDRAAYHVLRHDNPVAGCNVGSATVRTVIPVSAGLTSYTDSGLTNGTTYCYWVRVVRKGAEISAGSANDCVCNVPTDAACSANPPAGCTTIDSPFVAIVPVSSTAPTAPLWAANSAVVSTARNGSPALSLTWQTTANAVKYRIYRGTSQFGEYTILASCDPAQSGVGTDTTGCYVSAPITNYIDDDGGAGLDPSTTYYYKLKAVNSDGTPSNDSEVRWGKPGIDSICTYTPGANQTFVKPAQTPVSVDLVWCTFPGATSYLVEVASDPAITTVYFARTVTAPTTNTTWASSPFDVEDLPPTMYWRVSVLDGQNQILTQSSVVAGGQGTFNFQIQ